MDSITRNTTTEAMSNDIAETLVNATDTEDDIPVSADQCPPAAQGTTKTVLKYNVVGKNYEEIAVFSSEWIRKLEAIGAPGAMIKICSEVPMGKKEQTEILEAEVKSALTHWCNAGFEVNGASYKPMFAGSSDIRNAQHVWLREDLIPTMGKWAMCGVDTKTMKLAVNKYMAYIGLLASASKRFEEAFGKPIDIKRIVVVKDAEVSVDAIADIVSAVTGVSFEEARLCVINAFDGFGIGRKELMKGESCTIRGPWIKAFVQAIDWKKLVAFAFERGLKPEIVDRWGKTFALKNVDIILTESCFKAAKLYDSWSQYTNAFEALDHHICVCVREHKPRLKGMPYQQGQTLMGTKDDALHFMQHAKATVYKYHDPKEAAKLLRGYHRIAAKLYPALLNEEHTRKCIQEKYSSKRNDMLGGRIPELGYNAFLAPDMVAFAEHIFGLPIKGFLSAGECCCLAAKEGPTDVTRNPHLDNAHCILNNRLDMPFAEGPTMFINILDMVTIRLYSQDEYLLDLVNRTYEQIGNIPIDWDVGSAEKVHITKSAICGFITNLLHSSEIGIYADALTKMWNSKYDREVCDWLTYAGNVLIDAAKHAAVKIDKPQNVQDLSAVPLPEFARYAKADKNRPADSPYWDEIRPYTGTPRCAYSGSFLDMYSRAVKENVEETLAIDGTEDLVFDPYMLKIKQKRKLVPGIFKKGSYNKNAGTYEDCGIFNQMAFRHADEWEIFVATDGANMHRDEWEEARRNAALRELVFFARSQYADNPLTATFSDDAILDAVYDSLVTMLFATKMTEGMKTVLMNFFWLLFGDRVVKALELNGCKSGNESEDDKFDDDFDDELFAD